LQVSRSIFLRGAAAALSLSAEAAGSGVDALAQLAPVPRGPSSVLIPATGSADVTTPLQAQQPFTVGFHFRMEPGQPQLFELLSTQNFAVGIRGGSLIVDGMHSVRGNLRNEQVAALETHIGPSKDFHYVALVFIPNGEPEMRVYFDGTKVLSISYAYAPLALTTPSAWSVGGRSPLERPFASAEPAAFDLGSLRFWNVAHSAAQVVADAAQFGNRDAAPSPTLATEWLVSDTEPPRYWSYFSDQTVTINGNVRTIDTTRTGTLWEVAKRLAPIVYFHPKERFYPSSIEWYLQRSDLVRGKAKLSYGNGTFGLSRLNPGMTLIKRGPLTVDDLLGASNGAGENDDVSLWPSTDKAISGFGFSDQQRATLFGEPIVNGRCQAACYCRITQDQRYTFSDDQYYYFTYYFFYPYNGGLGPSALVDDDSGPMDGVRSGWEAHIGDWERVVARVAIAPRNSLWVTGSFAMEWHGNDEWKFFYQGEIRKVSVQNLAPFEVYSSWHSHASHPRIGTWPTDTSFADDRTAIGAIWKTGDNLVLIDDSTPWVNYNGLWGANMRVTGWGSLAGADGLKNGPPGPKQHDTWFKRRTETGATIPLRQTTGT
jgi:hypothetical protein